MEGNRTTQQYQLARCSYPEERATRINDGCAVLTVQIKTIPILHLIITLKIVVSPRPCRGAFAPPTTSLSRRQRVSFATSAGDSRRRVGEGGAGEISLLRLPEGGETAGGEGATAPGSSRPRTFERTKAELSQCDVYRVRKAVYRSQGAQENTCEERLTRRGRSSSIEGAKVLCAVGAGVKIRGRSFRTWGHLSLVDKCPIMAE